MPYLAMPVWKVQKGTAGPAMPSSPIDLKPAHISPSPPACVSSSNNHISSSTISNQNVSAQTVNGIHSPNANTAGLHNAGQMPLSMTPSPPTSQISLSLRQISKLKRFLTTLYQFTCDISVEVGEKVQTLIIVLLLKETVIHAWLAQNSSLTVEEFHQKIQEVTHYPLRPYVVPFLKLHLPALQNEILHVSRLSKMTPAQYIRQNESFILDVFPQNNSNGATEPFEIFQPQESNSVVRELKRKTSPDLRRDVYIDNSDRIEVQPPAKRHQPNSSPAMTTRLSPAGVTPTLVHNHSASPSILHSHLSSTRTAMIDEIQRERESSTGLYHIPSALRDGMSNGRVHSSSTSDHFTDRFAGISERYEKELFSRPSSMIYTEMHRNYGEDMSRDMEEEWKNIYTMLNCILGMVEKTKRALAILQQRSMEHATSSSSLWPSNISVRGRHYASNLDASHPDYHEIKKSRDQFLSTIHFSKPTEISNLSDSIRRSRPQSNNNQIGITIKSIISNQFSFILEDAVNEVKRQAVAELQKAVSAAESKASELVAAERAKMERLISEARRHAAEDALAAMAHQEDSNENCWNCGRKATETCSGCNVARYCGAFCQHKDWENHHRSCGQNREVSANTSTNTVIPTTITELKRTKASSPIPPSTSSQSTTSIANQRTVHSNGEHEKPIE
ncbi:protein CBFA2T1-like protein [Leptotrombidium deliense]|uniref:Protein CBFA2T1-like protein n=1 Tax=Leptotrombidium deliense TaxID=299467 RepID=A0A443SMI0_9ACAR|nr:protein CBFA2T1-like protein [Leptotrombidium deliense]